MNCQEFENRFNDLLDDRKPTAGDPALTAHAQTCGECRELLAAEGRLWTGLKAGRATPPGRDFADAVLAELSRPQLRPRSAFRLDGRWLAVALTAVAAMTLLMYSPAWYRQRVKTTEPQMAALEPTRQRTAAGDIAESWEDYNYLWSQLAGTLPANLQYAEELAPSGTWTFVAYALDFFRFAFPDEPRPTPANENTPRGAGLPLPRGAVWS